MKAFKTTYPDARSRGLAHRGPSLARSSASKSTCRNCNRTVHVFNTVDGQQVMTDPELIAVIVEQRGDETKRKVTTKVLAHRVHAERCEEYKLSDERKAWAEEQKRKSRKPTVREVRAQQKAINQAKRAGLPIPTFAAQQSQPIEATSKRVTVDDARRAVLARYAPERVRLCL